MVHKWLSHYWQTFIGEPASQAQYTAERQIVVFANALLVTIADITSHLPSPPLSSPPLPLFPPLPSPLLLSPPLPSSILPTPSPPFSLAPVIHHAEQEGGRRAAAHSLPQGSVGGGEVRRTGILPSMGPEATEKDRRTHTLQNCKNLILTSFFFYFVCSVWFCIILCSVMWFGIFRLYVASYTCTDLQCTFLQIPKQ